MIAARLHGSRDIRLEETESPTEIGPDEVRVAPQWTGICGTDLHEYLHGPIIASEDPHPLTGAQMPQILGHEFSAVVQEVGDEVSTVAAGDRVSIMPLVYCEDCYFC